MQLELFFVNSVLLFLCIQAVQAVRTHELRAYVIYIKPPPLERLRETRQESVITTNYYVNRPFKVNFSFFCQ